MVTNIENNTPLKNNVLQNNEDSPVNSSSYLKAGNEPIPDPIVKYGGPGPWPIQKYDGPQPDPIVKYDGPGPEPIPDPIVKYGGPGPWSIQKYDDPQKAKYQKQPMIARWPDVLSRLKNFFYRGPSKNSSASPSTKKKSV